LTKLPETPLVAPLMLDLHCRFLELRCRLDGKTCKLLNSWCIWRTTAAKRYVTLIAAIYRIRQ